MACDTNIMWALAQLGPVQLKMHTHHCRVHRPCRPSACIYWTKTSEAHSFHEICQCISKPATRHVLYPTSYSTCCPWCSSFNVFAAHTRMLLTASSKAGMSAPEPSLKRRNSLLSSLKLLPLGCTQEREGVVGAACVQVCLQCTSLAVRCLQVQHYWCQSHMH